MRSSIYRSILACFVLAGIVSGADGGKIFCHRQRSPNRCCVPDRNYEHDIPRRGSTVFAVVAARADERVKPFHVRSTALRADHVRLDQIGLRLYKRTSSSDQLPASIFYASGRIAHDGGDGGLIGNNVTIRIRAYVAKSVDPNRVPPDAVVVWSCQRRLWISRGRPQYISLLPAHLPQVGRLNAHFDEITHLEVEMEYELDR